ncbi:MAG: hypothetical protein HYW24_02650 [Candidatus Aenigmarchaeota archaeon]|nr:hypothetical protein [Candidatus Aenigmarchaeota archaeon]
MKAQSLIIQFIIFFTISLSVFFMVGNLFRYQYDLIRRDVLQSSSELTAEYLSAVAIKAVDTCKSCDNVSITLNVKPSAGYNPTIRLDDGILVKIEPENKIVQSSIHNLKDSIRFQTNDVSSVQPITLTYERENNILGIE